MAPQLYCCVVNTFSRCSASRWIWRTTVRRRSTHAKAPYAWPPSLCEFCVTTPSKHPQKRITQHLFCVQRNPTFQFVLEVDEKIFSMLNVCIKGVARGALSISRICYDLFQSQLMKTIGDCWVRQELIPCCIAATSGGRRLRDLPKDRTMVLFVIALDQAVFATTSIASRSA